MAYSLRILGTRGVPARYGGFETCAERVALHLAERGWAVTVYCQVEGSGAAYEDEWRGIRRVHFPIARRGAIGVLQFDWKSTLHAAREEGLILTLGYNTGVFFLAYRLKGLVNVVNMDGMEWKRDKWGPFATAWLYANERAACLLADHLISDHPAITSYLATHAPESKITTIAYGADRVTAADARLLDRWSLPAGRYAILVARPQRDNLVLEIVRTWSLKVRGMKLVVLGDYGSRTDPYQREVRAAAGAEILFAGGVYDPVAVGALRFHCRLHVHGHRMGGTNPSLLESMGAGAPILAHDNPYNRWVAGAGAAYFGDAADLAAKLDLLLADDASLESLRAEAIRRHGEAFTWDQILGQYESLLAAMHARQVHTRVPSSSRNEQTPR